MAIVQNVKHKLLLGLMYSSGLRVSEVVNLKIGDLDFGNRIVRVRQGKGAKDRATIMAQKITGVLKKYVRNKKIDRYVFESKRGGRLMERSVQKIFAN